MSLGCPAAAPSRTWSSARSAGVTQAETLIAMRTTAPHDRRAILQWVEYHAVARELVESLPSLTDGEAWVCSPHWLGTFQRIRFRRRATFDSGATPTTLGRSRRRPSRTTSVRDPLAEFDAQ
jgi:hypothetical protein